MKQGRSCMDKGKAFSVRDAAVLKGCSLKYIYDLIYSKKIPAKKSGRSWSIPADAVEVLTEKRSAKAARRSAMAAIPRRSRRKTEEVIGHSAGRHREPAESASTTALEMS